MGDFVRVVAGALIREDGQILLGHRTATRRHYPGVWDLPGGHIEAGETSEEAIARELREELGVAVSDDISRPWKPVSFGNIEMSVFLIRDWTDCVANLAPEEHDTLAWFGEQDLASLSMAHPSYQHLLTDALRSAP